MGPTRTVKCRGKPNYKGCQANICMVMSKDLNKISRKLANLHDWQLPKARKHSLTTLFCQPVAFQVELDNSLRKKCRKLRLFTNRARLLRTANSRGIFVNFCLKIRKNHSIHQNLTKSERKNCVIQNERVTRPYVLSAISFQKKGGEMPRSVWAPSWPNAALCMCRHLANRGGRHIYTNMSIYLHSNTYVCLCRRWCRRLETLLFVRPTKYYCTVVPPPGL